MTTITRKGKSPHQYVSMEKRKRRPRGSRPIDIVYQIYEKGGNFICPITAEDPAEYFKKYRKIWIPQRIHYPISYMQLVEMGVEDPNAIQYTMFASPNGHNMLDNYHRGIIRMEKDKAQTCNVCGINSWDLFQKHKKVLRMEKHHVTATDTITLCVSCHAATEDHSVNDGKVPFPAGEFAKLVLDQNIINLTTLFNVLKKFSPKIKKELIQLKFYGMGLHRHFDNKYLPPPNYIRKHFQNKNANKFFNL